MIEIPQPEQLDAHRTLRRHGTEITSDDRSREKLLQIELERSCAYGRQLWDTLDEVRRYLLAALPPDRQASSSAANDVASPISPREENGWQHWINAYAAVTSILCGPAGDEGIGLSEAKLEADHRRNGPAIQPDPTVPSGS